MTGFADSNIVPLRDRRSWENGRNLFYEGDDPDGFAEAVKTKTGFDPRTSPPLPDEFFICHPGSGCGCGKWAEDSHHRPFAGYPFYCPDRFAEAVHGLEDLIGT